MRAERNLPRVIISGMVAALLFLGAATPGAANDLYRSQTLITGQLEPNRLIGFAVCLEQVLIKVSGAISLTGGAEMIMPGDNVDMNVELITPIALETGQRFAIREGGHTVGAGAITEIVA